MEIQKLEADLIKSKDFQKMIIVQPDRVNQKILDDKDSKSSDELSDSDTSDGSSAPDSLIEREKQENDALLEKMQ